MAMIRASCDTCGDVEFTTAEVTVQAPHDGGAGTYQFSCPRCSSTVIRRAEPHTMDLLIAAGVSYSMWRRPAELVEREAVPGRAFTHTDLVAFQELMADDAALHRALERATRGHRNYWESGQ